MADAGRAIDIGVRIVNLIDTGSRESTYKLATLLALCQYSTEHHLQDVGQGLTVGVDDLADRVIALYWRQREPFVRSGGPLNQVKDGTSQIFGPIDRLRAEAALAFDSPTLWRARGLPSYPSTRRRVAQVLAQMPLAHLQRAQRGRYRDPFLYDDSRFHKKMTVAELDAVQRSLTLHPGVARMLAELGPLLAPLIESAWVVEVRRFNDVLADESVLEQHLFGMARSSLAAVRDPLVAAQAGRCFYCRRMLDDVHIDHVLPWSRTGLDDLANLVACDPACNLDKSDSLPAVEHILRAARRDGLGDIAMHADWPAGEGALLQAARGAVAVAPVGIRLWVSRGHIRELTAAGRQEALRALR